MAFDFDALLFDLDGMITRTAGLHAAASRKLSETLSRGGAFVYRHAASGFST